MSAVETVASVDMSYRAVRQRLMNPPGGRASTELDIVSKTERRRQAIAEETKKAIIFRQRRRKLFEALIEAHERTGHQLIVRPNDGSKNVTLAQIAQVICRYFKTPRAILFSIRRKANLVRPRHVMMYLAMELTDLSFPQVGRFMAGRDHTTVLHGHRKIGQLLAAGDEALAQDIAAIKKMLGAE